jgi:aryl-alcohol dehydrogenase-like predicted oxidoreductase
MSAIRTLLNGNLRVSRIGLNTSRLAKDSFRPTIKKALRHGINLFEDHVNQTKHSYNLSAALTGIKRKDYFLSVGTNDYDNIDESLIRFRTIFDTEYFDIFTLDDPEYKDPGYIMEDIIPFLLKKKHRNEIRTICLKVRCPGMMESIFKYDLRGVDIIQFHNQHNLIHNGFMRSFRHMQPELGSVNLFNSGVLADGLLTLDRVGNLPADLKEYCGTLANNLKNNRGILLEEVAFYHALINNYSDCMIIEPDSPDQIDLLFNLINNDYNYTRYDQLYDLMIYCENYFNQYLIDRTTATISHNHSPLPISP